MAPVPYLHRTKPASPGALVNHEGSLFDGDGVRHCQLMASSVFREQWCHFFPEGIANLPLINCHALPSGITGSHYTSVPFGMDSYNFFAQDIIYPIINYSIG